MKYPIDEFNEKFYRKNKLTIILEGFYNGVFFGQRFVENNKNNCKLIINSSEYSLQQFDNINLFFSEKKWNYNKIIFKITLIEINRIIDMSYFFFDCQIANYKLIDFSEWDISNVVNMSYMFGRCEGKLPDISKWDTSKVNNINGMFSGYLGSLPDISKWNTSNVVNKSNMFNLYFDDIPDISKWDISNVKNMSCMFSNYFGNIPYISKWDTSNVKDMSYMFYRDINADNLCQRYRYAFGYLLEKFKNIAQKRKLEISNIIDMCGENPVKQIVENYFLIDCLIKYKSLVKIPYISK